MYAGRLRCITRSLVRSPPKRAPPKSKSVLITLKKLFAGSVLAVQLDDPPRTTFKARPADVHLHLRHEYDLSMPEHPPMNEVKDLLKREIIVWFFFLANDTNEHILLSHDERIEDAYGEEVRCIFPNIGYLLTLYIFNP